MRSERIFHPPFNFALLPDLGGTSIDFSKEIWQDKLVLKKENAGVVTKIEIPGERNFLYLTVEDEKGNFLEAYYDHRGEMTAGSLWLARYFNNLNFRDMSLPGESLLSAMEFLDGHDMDIIVTADIQANDLYFFLVKDVSEEVTPEVIAEVRVDLPMEKLMAFEFIPTSVNGEDLFKISIIGGFSDNTLSLGFSLNEDRVYYKDISTKINCGRLNIRSTPKDMENVLENVFLAI